MIHRLAIVLCLGLAACQGAEQPPAARDSTDPAPANVSETDGALSPAGPEALPGEYRVAGIDGAPLDAPIGIALSIDEERMSFEPTCAGFVWTYSYEDSVLDTERDAATSPAPPNAPSPPAVPPPVPCAIGIRPEQAALGRALDAVTRAERDPSNAIVLSGGGHSVTLYTQ